MQDQKSHRLKAEDAALEARIRQGAVECVAKRRKDAAKIKVTARAV
jgi:hypothetical protein